MYTFETFLRECDLDKKIIIIPVCYTEEDVMIIISGILKDGSNMPLTGIVRGNTICPPPIPGSLEVDTD